METPIRVPKRQKDKTVAQMKLNIPETVLVRIWRATGLLPKDFFNPVGADKEVVVPGLGLITTNRTVLANRVLETLN